MASLAVDFSSVSLRSRGRLRSFMAKRESNIERLSSGKRLNRFGDDLQRSSVASKLELDIRSGQQAKRNILDHVSLNQTAESGLAEIQKVISRLRELAVQAANEGSYKDSDRSHIDLEAQLLLSEVDRIAKATEYNGTHPLSSTTGDKDLLVLTLGSGSTTLSATYGTVGSGSPVIPKPDIDGFFGGSGVPKASASSTNVLFRIPANSSSVEFTMDDLGADDDIHIFASDGEYIVGDGSAPAGVVNVANGFDAGAVYDNSNVTTSGAFASGSTMGTYSGELKPGSNIETVTIGGSVLNAQIGNGSSSSDQITQTTFGMTKDALGLTSLSLSSATQAAAAIDLLDQSMSSIADARSTLGGNLNRLNFALSSINQELVADSQSLSTTRDADIAEESSSLARLTILSDAATSIVAQTRNLENLKTTLIQSLGG